MRINLPLVYKGCRACELGMVIEWTGNPPNDIFKVVRCKNCHG